MQEQQRVVGGWLPLMDYAMKKGVSLSTLRRHIKSNKVKFKVENGKYWLFDDGRGAPIESPPPPVEARPNSSVQRPDQSPNANPTSGGDNPLLQSKLRRLEEDLRKAQEEIAELKMLIALYEENMSTFRFNN